MKLVIDEREIAISPDLTDEAFGEAWVELLSQYEHLDDTVRMGLKLLARKFLSGMEKKHGKAFRPPKGQDPTLHLAGILFSLMDGVMQRASIEITTASPEHASAASIAFAVEDTRKSWRQVADHGHDGERENHLLEETARSLS